LREERNREGAEREIRGDCEGAGDGTGVPVT
jgi:hypothetical protein